MVILYIRKVIDASHEIVPEIFYMVVCGLSIEVLLLDSNTSMVRLQTGEYKNKIRESLLYIFYSKYFIEKRKIG